MNLERWQRIDHLYHSALELEASRRAGFLEQASSGDEELRREVEALLAANEEAPRNFLAAPALQVAAEAVASDQEAALGQMLGHYRMLSHLGQGGMAQVYLAQDTRLPRKVALKLFPKEYTQDRERFRRFEQEARAASALNHPNIITIYEILECEGQHFIVTEFIDGETLRGRVPGPLMKLREILDIAIQVAGALAAAHEAGIVHRDIKPENIMVRRDGYVKVLDFGLAKLIEPFSQAGPTHSASPLEPALDTDPERVMGTARYMSPEQVLGRQIDGRSDIFSLGTVLFEMLTRVAPFQGETAGEVFRAILNHEPPPIAAYRKGGNAELERIVGKTLAKDRDERYQVVKDLLIDLKSLKEDLDFESRRRRDTQTSANAADTREEPDRISQPLTAVRSSGPARPIPQPWEFEPPGGAVGLNSNSYIVRSADYEFHSAITRHDSVVLVKGPHQVGKTSLLARGLQKAREAGACVVLSDFQNLSARSAETIDNLLQALSELIADQLNLDMLPAEIWNPRLSPSINFEHFLRRKVFEKFPAPIVWGLDEVDWLFTCEFGSEVFGLFRSWHNKRALDPSAPWHRFTLAIAYATEAQLFITDLNQSPFNVGTRLTLEDFSIDQVEEFNRRYGSPLKNRAELARFYRLVGGHPYLVHCGLHEMVVHGLDLHALESLAGLDEGPFGDHLRRLLVSLSQDPALCNVMRAILQGQPCPTSQSFFRLRSAGLVGGESAQFVRPRCQLYATYLERHVL